jgi:hypothetical protein
MYQVPEGEDPKDERWQAGYADGWKEGKPVSEDPVYISGWCHGYSEAAQISLAAASTAYLDSLYRDGL